MLQCYFVFSFMHEMRSRMCAIFTLHQLARCRCIRAA